MKDMKGQYIKMIQYEGHVQFLNLLYYIEQQMNMIDLTVKKEEYTVDGRIARERKFGIDNIERVLDTKVLTVEDSLQSENSQAIQGSFQKGDGGRVESMPEELLPDTKQKFFGFFAARRRVSKLIQNPLRFYD